jgi:hypothetical protein
MEQGTIEARFEALIAALQDRLMIIPKPHISRPPEIEILETIDQGKVLATQYDLEGLHWDEQEFQRRGMEITELTIELESCRKALDGDPCNYDFQKEAVDMWHYANWCLLKLEEVQAQRDEMVKKFVDMQIYAKILEKKLGIVEVTSLS